MVWVLIIMHIVNQTSPDLFCVVVKSRNASAQYYVVITAVMSFDSLIIPFTATPTDPELRSRPSRADSWRSVTYRSGHRAEDEIYDILDR